MRGGGVVCALALSVAAAAPGAEIDWRGRMTEGLALHERGEYAKADAWFRQTLKMADAAGAGEEVRMPVLVAVANQTFELGRYGEAERLFRRVLREMEERHGKLYAEYGLQLTNLAMVETARRHRDRAEALIREAIPILRAVEGEDGLRLALARNVLAETIMFEGKPVEAEQMLQQARTVIEKNLGARHERVAIVINNLAALRRMQERLAEAAVLFEQAANILVKSKGPDHPHLLRTWGNLATVYQDLGRTEEADALYRRALDAAGRRLGTDHPTYGTLLGNYSTLLRKTGRKAEAKAMSARSRAVLAGVDRRNGEGATVDARELAAFRK
jgi:tetratricopeptide (TPR) repeat protein